jgi:hypothetical protein
MLLLPDQRSDPASKQSEEGGWSPMLLLMSGKIDQKLQT